MRLEDKITRQRRRGGKRRRLVRDLSALDPTAHPREPTGRGPTFERTLDYLDPVFDGGLPPDAHVHGPKDVGKPAVVAALFEHLASALPARRSAIHTATRTAATPTTSPAYVDTRDAPIEFALLYAVLETLSKEPVPSQGVGVEALRERLTAWVAHDEHAVVAVDHVGEPEIVSVATAVETLSSVSPHVSVLTVGHDPRSDVTEAGDDDDAIDVTDAASTAVSAYKRHSLVDTLVTHASDGVARSAPPHVATREVTEWADGDAHGALSALYGAATLATTDGADTIDTEYVCADIDVAPDDSCSLGRMFALPESRRRVLQASIALNDKETASVSTATEYIVVSPWVSLSPATVRRVLHELSDLGIVRRVSDSDSTDGSGRPATRPVPNFSTLAFHGLGNAERWGVGVHHHELVVGVESVGRGTVLPDR